MVAGERRGEENVTKKVRVHVMVRCAYHACLNHVLVRCRSRLLGPSYSEI